MEAQQAQQAQEAMVNLWAFAFILGVMIFGAFSHWLKKRLRGELQGNFIAYLLADHLGSSSLAYGSIFFTSLASAATSAASFVDPRLLWAIVVNTGSMPAVQLALIGGAFWAGWGFDSSMNKGGA